MLDKIDFGLNAGEELDLKTTICDEIRGHGRAVVIDHVDADTDWRTHHTPMLYGFKSYISYPIGLSDGSFFGTLCAIDPDPHKLDTGDRRPVHPVCRRNRQSARLTASPPMAKEPLTASRFSSPVKKQDKADQPSTRARKLKLQSDNCVAIAIRESEAETAAMLLDEATKLARRARELGGG